MRASQSKRILEYLKGGGSLSANEALRMFGCGRLAARISDLKKQGYNFNTTAEVQRGADGEYKCYARYRLAE
jgi:hypothetical protein